jgi:hypothetical protein
METASDGVGFHSDADQIIRAEHFESLCAGKAHTSFMIQEGFKVTQVSRFQGCAGFTGFKVAQVAQVKTEGKYKGEVNCPTLRQKTSELFGRFEWSWGPSRCSG